MKLYNTLTKNVEDFKPLEDNIVRVYSCGPTVYDNAHIGNLSAFIYADTLRRTLKASGFEVQHVMNFTDVDDKTIERSRKEHPDTEPKQALRELTEHYAGIFLDDMRSIGNDVQALEFKKATDFITEIQELIQKLLVGGIAYVADDGVYFSIEAYRAKGKTYGQLIKLEESNTAEARIQNDEYDKESIHDFALWKKQKDGEPSWQFEIDGQQLDGRPGWHIECSAMSKAALGTLPFDIHTGGIDLVFPHHENEIAQSTALESQDKLANMFFHNEHILVDGKKMSKSLGNFYTLNEISSKGVDPLAFRLLVLQSHYRSQTNFTFESLGAMQTVLQELRAWADLRFQGFHSDKLRANYAEALPELAKEFSNDLATPAALAVLNGIKNRVDELGIDSDAISQALPLIDDLFGLSLQERVDINQSEKELLAARARAREAQDWQASDSIRDQLLVKNIRVRDSPHGQIWERV